MLSWQFNGFSLEREVREMLASNLPRIYWIINIKKWIKARRNLVAHSKAIESYDSSFFLARTTLKFESRHIHIPSTQQEPTRPNFLLPPFNPNRWRAKFSISFHNPFFKRRQAFDAAIDSRWFTIPLESAIRGGGSRFNERFRCVDTSPRIKGISSKDETL